MEKLSRKKTRIISDPYEIWEAKGIDGLWEWRILKFYSEKSIPGQRVLVAVKSPYTFRDYEIGDSYYQEIIGLARKVPELEWGKFGKPTS